jgi:hypothetical protein
MHTLQPLNHCNDLSLLGRRTGRGERRDHGPNKSRTGLAGPNLSVVLHRKGRQLIDRKEPTVFLHACRLGAEGIVSKNVDGTYRSGPCRGSIKVRTGGWHPAAGLVLRRATRARPTSSIGTRQVRAACLSCLTAPGRAAIPKRWCWPTDLTSNCSPPSFAPGLRLWRLRPTWVSSQPSIARRPASVIFTLATARVRLPALTVPVGVRPEGARCVSQALRRAGLRKLQRNSPSQVPLVGSAGCMVDGPVM